MDSLRDHQQAEHDDKVSRAVLVERAIFNEVSEERSAQDKQWGGPEHDDTNSCWNWILYILSHARAGGAKVRGVPAMKDIPEALHLFRYQMVRVAALAIAAIESVDRAIARMGK